MTKEECKKLFKYVTSTYNLNMPDNNVIELLNDWFDNLQDVDYQQAYYSLINGTYHVTGKPNAKWLKQQIKNWEEQKSLWGFKDKYTEKDLEKSKKELLELWGN